MNEVLASDSLKEDSDPPVTIRTATRVVHFRGTMARLSNEKLAMSSRLGFGDLYRLRCGKLNLQLLQILVENFNVVESCIKIHGRNFKIREEDFVRILGLRVGGREIVMEGSVEDPDIVSLQRKIRCYEEKITVHELSRLLLDPEIKCDDDIFKVSFALYVLATLLCPRPGSSVDPAYLIPLKDPNGISSLNWGKFGFSKLVEGVSAFQSTRSGLAGGCLLFLQLFYLDVVGKGGGIPRLRTPVREWGSKYADTLFEMVEENGGFKSDIVRVTKKPRKPRTCNSFSQVSGSVDGSTGIKVSVVGDLNEAKSEVRCMKGDMELMQSSVGQLEPDMSRLRSAVMALENCLSELKSTGVGQLISHVVKGAVEESQFFGDLESVHTESVHTESVHTDNTINGRELGDSELGADGDDVCEPKRKRVSHLSLLSPLPLRITNVTYLRSVI